jgi:hypothetical protein
MAIMAIIAEIFHYHAVSPADAHEFERAVFSLLIKSLAVKC